ncbi:hypothetical protein CFI10_07195 [Marinobacterium iners]|uniref:hypothetical protein n=1 Tax=Marinobacterium iners TaxID=48076 RepID=UPI001A8F9AA9|nr:hypothetical protein [Marinobacterium iners]QSR34781.1 hypothetical protein CFI10_07195 [Marinobacterium iners]
MNVLRVITCIGAGLVLAGCSGVGVSVKLNGADVTSRSFDSPEIGRVVTAGVGEQMLSKGLVYEQTVLTISKPIGGAQYQIHPSQYPQIGYDDKWTFYSAAGVTRMSLADPITALGVPKGKPQTVCTISPIFGTSTCYKGSYKIEKRSIVGKESFQQTLLYSGRVGNKINISYREFSNSMARPAFNNEVEYDLSVSNVIGYKGASIEVINADNSSITYRVVRNFR